MLKSCGGKTDCLHLPLKLNQMKKLLFIALIAFGINAKAQIVLVHTYNSAGQYNNGKNWQQLYIVKFEVDGDKFVFADKADKLLRFYNLNHTQWKTISFANATDLDPIYNTQNIIYISQHLFNTDDKIEFLYVDESGGVSCVTQIINEDDSILFSANNQAPFLYASVPQAQMPIYNTSAGTFMILSGYISDGNAYVYSLPGTLSAAIHEANQSLLVQSSISNPYPNPTNNSTRIDYTFPDGVNEGEIVFYDLKGVELKRFRVDRTFDHLLLSTADLPAGTYFFQLQTSRQNSEGKKMVVIK